MIKILGSDWTLRRGDDCPADIDIPDDIDHAPFCVPGDVHSALLETGHIDDPYFRDNELVVDWVNRCDWIIERKFEVDSSWLDDNAILVLDQVDCIADIYINNIRIGATQSQFVRYTFDAGTALTAGSNTIRIHFHSAVKFAAQKAAEFPFELPHSANCRLPHSNLLRKTPCHAGWDWNICLMPTGIYGQIKLVQQKNVWLEEVKLEQQCNTATATVTVTARVHVAKAHIANCKLTLCGVEARQEHPLIAGSQEVTLTVEIKKPKLWWPAGSGPQTRHLLQLDIDDQHHQQLIGLRKAVIVLTPDDPVLREPAPGGHAPGDHAPGEPAFAETATDKPAASEHTVQSPGSGFRIDINDRQVFMRGANWIPADALPQRSTPEVTRELLQSAVDANMNMLRVWGGGQYEANWFYDLCDELGILIWQDFMFSCNHYPAADADWLNLVRTEARQQVWRLSSYACVVLWCGDNEIVGALNWWEVTRNNRDRYLANYVRLNHALEEIVEQELATTSFWPSSPSVGKLNYGDGWKNDAAGDMHFWDVWHEAKPFSAYQDIHPRFCSEFGFQSFPSLEVIKTFTVPDDRNVSSPVMDIHQRNVGGNARIVETLVRYFEFPDSFERLLFLSQCQQAMAIRTGVEYWRSLQPHCMGTLYWQLNDTWPVASWSSLEYGGGWKLLHYAARRFYQPLLVTMVPGHSRFGTDGQLLLKAVNDTTSAQKLSIVMRALTVFGEEKKRWHFDINATPGSVSEIINLHPDEIPDHCFVYWQWNDSQGTQLGYNEYWLAPYKNYPLPKPNISFNIDEQHEGRNQVIELHTDAPAFFVTVNLGGQTVYTDNGFTLLPGEPKRIGVSKTLNSKQVPVVTGNTIQFL